MEFIRDYFSLLNGDSEESVRCSYCSVLNVNENDLRISFENTCTDSLVTAFDDEALLICDQGTEMARAKVLFVLVVPNHSYISINTEWELLLLMHMHSLKMHSSQLSVSRSVIYITTHISLSRVILHYLVKQ